VDDAEQGGQGRDSEGEPDIPDDLRAKKISPTQSWVWPVSSQAACSKSLTGTRPT
jgi:hypothetical protein